MFLAQIVFSAALAAPCDRMVGKELKACLLANYDYAGQIETLCLAQEEGYYRWKCRQDEYAKHNVIINPPILRNGPPAMVTPAPEVAPTAPAPVPVAEPSTPLPTPAPIVPTPVPVAPAPSTPPLPTPDPIVPTPAPAAPAPSVGEQVGDFATRAQQVCANHTAVPLTVAVLVRNAREVAIAKKGQALVAAGELAASMGLIDSIPEQVYAEIGKQASDAFAAENVPVSVGQGVYNVQATTGYVWTKGTKTQARLPAGQYRLLRITVLDSIGAACAEADALVGLVVAAGDRV